MAEGFTKFASDFTKLLKDNGTDILETTETLEKLLRDHIDYISNPLYQTRIFDNIENALDALLDQFDTDLFDDLDGIKEQVVKLLESISTDIGVDLSMPFDPNQIVGAITELIPDAAMPAELKDFYTQVKEFIAQFPLDDIKVKVKSVKTPVSKPQNVSAIAGASASKSIPSNFGIFNANQNNASSRASSTEFLIQDIQRLIQKTFPGTDSFVETFFEEIETSFSKSGFLIDLRNNSEEFLKNIKGGEFTVPAIIDAVNKFMVSILRSAIRATKFIFGVIKTHFTDLINQIKEFLEVNPGEFFAPFLSQLGVQTKTTPNPFPSLLTPPVLLLATPLTLLSNLTTGKPPTFASITSSVLPNPNNIVYGVVQWLKIAFPVMDTYGSGTLQTGASIMGPIADIVGQIFSSPFPDSKAADLEKRFKKGFFGEFVWDYQWIFNVGFPIFTAYISLKKPHKARQWEKRIMFVDFLRELVHYALFMALFGLEDKTEKIIENDTWDESQSHYGLALPSHNLIKATFFLDSFPGIVGGIVSFAKFLLEKPTKEEAATFLFGQTDAAHKAFRLNIPHAFPISPIQAFITLLDDIELEDELELIKTEVTRIKDTLRHNQGTAENRIIRRELRSIETNIDTLIDTINYLNERNADFTDLFNYHNRLRAFLRISLLNGMPNYVQKLNQRRYEEALALVLEREDVLSTDLNLFNRYDRRFSRRVRSIQRSLDNRADRGRLRNNFLNKLDRARTASVRMGQNPVPGQNLIIPTNDLDALIVRFQNIWNDNEDALLFEEELTDLRDVGRTRRTALDNAKTHLKVLTGDDPPPLPANKKKTIDRLDMGNVGISTVFQILYGLFFILAEEDPGIQIDAVDISPDIASGKDSYEEGDVLTITATFSETLTATQIPTISVYPPGGTAIKADSMTSSDSKIFTYTYTIGAEEGDVTFYIKVEDKGDLAIFSGINEFPIN